MAANVTKGKYATWVALCVLTAAGGYLRFAGLGARSFWIDEGFSVVHAQAILEHGYPLLADGAASWSYLPAHYLMAAGMALFPGLHFGARFFPALAGTLAVPALFLLAWRMGRMRSAALLAAGMLAFMTYEIAWSRQARGYVILQFLALCAFASFMGWLRERKARQLAGALLCATLSPLVHRAGYLVPAVLVLLALPEWRRRGEWAAWLGASRARAAGLGISVILLLAVVVATWRTNSNPLSMLNDLESGAGQSYGMAYLGFLFKRFGYTLPWALAGMVFCLRKESRRYGWPVVVGIGLYFFVIAERTVLFHYRYLLPLLPLVVLFAALGVGWLLQLIWRSRRRGADLLAALAGGLFAWCLLTMELNLRPYDRYYLGPTAPQPEWERAFAWVTGDAAARGGAGTLQLASAFPELAAIYAHPAGNYYLPVSLTGLPAGADIERRLYVPAATLDSVAALKAWHGYLVLDDLALRGLKNHRLREFLRERKPDQVVPGPFPVYIWRV